MGNDESQTDTVNPDDKKTLLSSIVDMYVGNSERAAQQLEQEKKKQQLIQSETSPSYSKALQKLKSTKLISTTQETPDHHFQHSRVNGSMPVIFEQSQVTDLQSPKKRRSISESKILENSQTEKEVNLLKERLNQYENKLTESRFKIAHTENKLRETFVKKEADEKKISFFEQRHYGMDKQIKDQGVQIANLQWKNNQLNGACTNLQRQKESLNVLHRQKIEALNVRISEIQNLNRQKLQAQNAHISQIELSKQKLQISWKTAEQKIAELTSQVALKGTQFEEANLRIGSLETVQIELKTRVEEIKSELSGVEGALSIAALKQKELLEAGRHKQEEFEEVMRRKEEEMTETMRLKEEELTDNKNEIAQALLNRNTQIDLLEEEMRQLRVDNNAFQHQTQEIKNYYGSIKGEYQKQSEIGQQQINELTSQLAFAQDKIRSLAEEARTAHLTAVQGQKIFEKKIIYQLKKENDRLWNELIKKSEDQPFQSKHRSHFMKSSVRPSNSHISRSSSSTSVHKSRLNQAAYQDMRKRVDHFLTKLEDQYGTDDRHKNMGRSKSASIHQSSMGDSKVLNEEVTYYKQKNKDLQRLVDTNIGVNKDLQKQMQQMASNINVNAFGRSEYQYEYKARPNVQGTIEQLQKEIADIKLQFADAQSYQGILLQNFAFKVKENYAHMQKQLESAKVGRGPSDLVRELDHDIREGLELCEKFEEKKA